MKNIVQIFYGTPDSWFYAVIALVILDYITGVCAAIHSRELSSEIGAKGIAKKITTFAVISLAHILDEYVLKDGGAIQTMTSIFYIVNESISILENAIRTGLPVPEKLKSIIRSLGKSEESSEISDEKEEKWIADMTSLVRYMEKNGVWADNIVQIHVEDNGDLTLIPREGKERFLFGKPDRIEEKFELMSYYYRSIVPAKGKDFYSSVNLKFDKQIICKK